MKSFSSSDFKLVTCLEDTTAAIACFKTYGQKVENLSGTTFVAKADRDNYWRIDFIGTQPDGTKGPIEHIDVFQCLPIKLGFICNPGRERTKQGDDLTNKTRIALRSEDPFTALMVTFFFNPRYNEHNISCPRPLYLAPIPMELRSSPPYLMTGNNLFVAYAPAHPQTKKNRPPSTIEDCLIFATHANSWAHTVTPQTTANRLLHDLKL
ncbi:MAG: hypothetical protein PHD48_02060 [Alphaproteobacteria bacterium]|nr:hypothetical protein [Alphaproteobacteria bacterium]